MTLDEELMLKALELAEKAGELGEVPVGAIVVNADGEIMGEGYNMREQLNSPTAHAEVIAIEQAAKALGRWRLSDCTLYVTLEPCPMCAGAIMNARLKRLVFGAYDDKNGACASVTCLFEKKFTHKPLIRGRIMADRCSDVLTRFFQDLRDTK